MYTPVYTKQFEKDIKLSIPSTGITNLSEITLVVVIAILNQIGC